jgi:lysophospholipase L1-like esterase
VSTLPTTTTAEATAPPARTFGVGKQILFSTIIVLALLLTSEGVVRLWAHYFRTSYERYNSQTGRLELKPNLRYVNHRGEEFRINARGFVGPDFDDVPAPGVHRIFALGDSCTFATGFWRIGYPSKLDGLLNEGAPTRRFEVINAGIEGYNSSFALDRIRDELLGYRPRTIILYIGWNDLMKTDPGREGQVDEHRWLAMLLDGSYLVKAYKKLLFVDLRPLVFRPSTVERPGDATAFDDFVPTRYRSNLEATIRLLRAHRVNVLLVTLPTVAEPGMSPEQIRQANVFFPHFAGAYGVARLLSLRAAYNRTIVDVGRREGVEVVDLAALFEPMPDKPTYFWDTMHPNDKGGAVIARALAERLRTLDAEGRL